MIWDNNEDIVCIRCANDRRAVQRHLDSCREERHPYVFITSTMREIIKLNRILVPVTMLEEEVYKAEICSYLARKTGAKLLLLPANDYGNKAKQNLNRIKTHLDNISQKTGETIDYEVLEAKKDSFSLAMECVDRQKDFGHQLLLLTASREYGLDDILFGPAERKVIRRSLVPVMLVNPRADLFSLCD